MESDAEHVGDGPTDLVTAPVPVPEASVPATLVERGLELVQAGGPVVVILAIMSVVALAILFVKLWQFHSARLGDRRRAQEILWHYRSGRAME